MSGVSIASAPAVPLQVFFKEDGCFGDDKHTGSPRYPQGIIPQHPQAPTSVAAEIRRAPAWQCSSHLPGGCKRPPRGQVSLSAYSKGCPDVIWPCLRSDLKSPTQTGNGFLPCPRGPLRHARAWHLWLLKSMGTRPSAKAGSSALEKRGSHSRASPAPQRQCGKWPAAIFPLMARLLSSSALKPGCPPGSRPLENNKACNSH